jgi:hypothetical protein
MPSRRAALKKIQLNHFNIGLALLGDTMWMSQRLTIMYSILMSPQVPEQHSQNHSSLSCVRLTRMKLCGCESTNSHWILKLKCTLLRRVTKVYFQYTDVNNFKTRMHKHPRYLTYNLPLI